MQIRSRDFSGPLSRKKSFTVKIATVYVRSYLTKLVCVWQHLNMFQVSSFKFIIIIYNNLFTIPLDRTGSLNFVFFLTIFVQASLLRSDHGTRNELAAQNNEAQGLGKYETILLIPREDKGASLLLIRVSPFCKTVTLLTLFQTLFGICNSGALARSGAPWVRKCGKLLIRENLVIT